MKTMRMTNVTMTTSAVAIGSTIVGNRTFAADADNAGTITLQELGTGIIIDKLDAGDSIDVNGPINLAHLTAKSTSVNDILIIRTKG